MKILGFDPFSPNSILIVIGAIAITSYFGAMVYAGALSLQSQGQQPEIPEFLTLLIATVSGTLATFLGMALGFRQASATGAVPSQMAAVFRLTWPQAIAAWAYVASLVLAVAFWAWCGFSADTAVTIQNLARSLLGLFGGALAVLLNVR